ncbi:MAG: hypothetical protein LBK99_17215 [Opitutaceae bacterium]|jgi:LacI family transcriptional regulator|nr:hypothetical protein [Opitutaceae bacterium]
MLSECKSELASWLPATKPDVVLAPFGGWQKGWHDALLKLSGNPGPGVVNLTLPPSPDMFAGIRQNARKPGEIAIERVVARLQHTELGPLDLIQNTMLHGEWHDGATLPGRVT